MKILILVFGVLTASVAHASWTAGDRNRVAEQLGVLIASEELCGLAYDQKAIARWIEENVPADDMGFPPMLQTVVKYTDLSKMSVSAKTAHCAQIAHIAKSHGFID